jgi:hypothetical protein
MSSETHDEKETTDVQQQNDAEIKPETKNAGDQSDAKSGEQKSTLEIVKALREERSGRAKEATADTKAAGSKPTQSDKAQSEGKDGNGADSKSESDVKAESKNESGDEDDVEFTLSEDDLSKPGWYDRLTKEQKAALDRQFPGISTIVNAGKAEAQRHVENAKKKAEQLQQSAPEPKKPTSAKDTEKAEDPDFSDAIDKLYDPKTYDEGLRLLLGNDKSKAVIKTLFNEFVKEELGVDIEQQKQLAPLREGFALASKDYPQLKEDDSFYDEVEELLKQDEEHYKELLEETKPRMIAAALREAAAKVVRSRAAKSTKPSEEKKVITVGRREKLERDTRAAKEQAGVKAGTSTRPGVPEAEPGSTLEVVRSLRKQRGYQHLDRGSS